MFPHINLGDTVRDRVTGFTGVATSRHEYLNGCVRYSIQPTKLKDGRMIEADTVDVQQLTVIKSAPQPKPSGAKGGPQKIPATRTAPKF